jgi:hypothetical protein
MSKNAKRQLKAVMEKHKKDTPVRPKRTKLAKPTCVMIPLLDLDDCLDYAIREKVITEDDSNNILRYMKETSDQAGYWDMCWGDIVGKYSLESSQPELSTSFKAFYELFKEHEIRDKEGSPYLHLHFDVGVYS